eukprot:COSAG02_NODE_8910_length_2403_cov_1.431858_1_plen_128_part_00
MIVGCSFAIDGVTAEVHLVSPSRPKIAFESHYVGDIRAINAEVLDAYQLKSLDAFIDVNLAGSSGARGGLQMYFYKREDGKIFIKWAPREENIDPSIAAYAQKSNADDDRRRQPEYDLQTSCIHASP